MVSYWTSFARTGSPTAPSGPEWPRFRPRRGQVLQLCPDAPREIDFAGEHNCGFWRRVDGG